jgi:hypothetical protein
VTFDGFPPLLEIADHCYKPSRRLDRGYYDGRLSLWELVTYVDVEGQMLPGLACD